MMARGPFLSSLLSLTVTPFFMFHCWLVSKNMTTLEYCEKRGSDGGLCSSYDQGLVRNVQSVMGERWYLWPLPLGAPAGDGVEWEAAEAPAAGGRFLPGAWLALCEIVEDLRTSAQPRP
mmetsp:Transcript_81437/g.263779  ORF Transcript_81437/g.263779 Transcript_81437/m.263779 type:complete len:119 (+) Transcript_81437:1-357(+)